MMEVAAPFKRLKPEEIVQAYKKSGVVPGTGAWAFTDRGTVCCCGIGMMVMLQDEKALEQLDPTGDIGDAGEILGLSLSYSTGFVIGFDGVTQFAPQSWYDPAEYKAGYDDGRATHAMAGPTHEYTEEEEE